MKLRGHLPSYNVVTGQIKDGLRTNVVSVVSILEDISFFINSLQVKD